MFAISNEYADFVEILNWITIRVCRHITKQFDKSGFDQLIQRRQLLFPQGDQLVKSRFIELFGDPVVNPKSWETAPLSALIINANNGMARRGKDEDGNIVLRLVELQNGFIDYSAPNRICLNETEKKRYELVDNDFLFARVNGNPDYVGRCAVFKSIEEPVFHNDHIIRVHFDETKINGCFTSVLLNSDYGKRQMREQIKTSAGQYTISQDGIGAIMAILPPLELQEQFATFVEQTDKSKFEIQKSLEKLETLKKALMQKYFG
jgi:type I restriction enzyme S subunit